MTKRLIKQNSENQKMEKLHIVDKDDVQRHVSCYLMALVLPIRSLENIWKEWLKSVYERKCLFTLCPSADSCYVYAVMSGHFHLAMLQAASVYMFWPKNMCFQPGISIPRPASPAQTKLFNYTADASTIPFEKEEAL